MREVIQRTVTGMLLVAIITGGILGGPIPFLLVLTLICYLSLRELFQVYTRVRSLPKWLMVIPAFSLLPFTYLVLDQQWNIWQGTVLFAVWFTGFALSGFSYPGRLVLLWLSLPFCAFYLLGWTGDWQNYEPVFPLSVISLIWINDTFAYLVGRSIGSHQLIPALSPGKTWEGLIGGLLFTLLSSWILFRITEKYTLTAWLSAGVVTTTLGLAGDLFESRLKRRLGLKNMGEILPGHGGILDRFDSLLFVSPAFLLLFYLLMRVG